MSRDEVLSAAAKDPSKPLNILICPGAQPTSWIGLGAALNAMRVATKSQAVSSGCDL
jgi:hypothetical protein